MASPRKWPSSPTLTEERTLIDEGNGEWVDRLGASKYGVAISPDGTRVAYNAYFVLEDVGPYGYFRLMETASGAQLFAFEHATMTGIAWSQDGARLWMGVSNHIMEPLAGGSLYTGPDIYTHTSDVHMLTYVAAFDLLVVPGRNDLAILDASAPSPELEVLQTIPLAASGWRVVCNASGMQLFVGCDDGVIRAFARMGSGTYDNMGEIKAHKQPIHGLSLSGSGSLLLVGSEDNTASLWRVTAPFSSFGASPLIILEGHSGSVMDTAFSGDEQFALTCSTDRTIRIWRVADGAEVGNFSCKGEVDGMSFHEASGLLAANVRCNGTVLFRYSPDGPSLPPPSTPNRRGRRQLAARKLSAIQERIASFEPSVGAAAAKERSLADEATRLKDRLVVVERELESLRTADYVKKREELAQLQAQETDLMSEISVHDHVLGELAENTKVPQCLHYLHGDGFAQWLHDVGLGYAGGALEDMDGSLLCTMSLDRVEDRGLSFADACALLLRGYLTHTQSSSGPNFSPPSGLLSWDRAATRTWLEGRGGEYSSLAALGWTGACLCSLNHVRVRGKLSMDAFHRLRAMVRDQLAAEGAPAWTQRWSALVPIEHHY